MKQGERQLYEMLSEDYDSFDDAFESSFESDSADRPLISPRTSQQSRGVGAKLGRSMERPVFSAQFDISVLTYYFDVTVATGAHAAIAAAALPATLKTQVPAFVFGNSDFDSGFSFSRGKLPLSGGWVYKDIYTYGKDEPDTITIAAATIAFPAAVSALLQVGDVVVELYYTSGGATDNKAIIILRCQQVSYSTLLSAISSDRFVINQLRYVIPDTTKVAQYSNQIRLMRQSLFGKNSEDFVSPQSFKKPEQFQNGVIDIPLKKGIDKETVLATYINYDCIQVDLSVFVWKTSKIVSK